MPYLDLAKAYDSVEYWALEAALRGAGIPEKVIQLMSRLDEAAKAKVLLGGEAEATDCINLKRGAPQGEVMSPLRFVAWINLLMEILDDYPSIGYKYGKGVDESYIGHAFCDDGWFVSESNEGLKEIAEIVSAFCEIFKVKSNANKSYYAISRGKVENGKLTDQSAQDKGTRPQESIYLWDHIGHGKQGKWEKVEEVDPDFIIRYLGVMIAANMNSTEQTLKVDKLIRGVIEKLRINKCSGSIAIYIVRACIGGIQNYHAPFTITRKVAHNKLGHSNQSSTMTESKH